MTSRVIQSTVSHVESHLSKPDSRVEPMQDGAWHLLHLHVCQNKHRNWVLGGSQHEAQVTVLR